MPVSGSVTLFKMVINHALQMKGFEKGKVEKCAKKKVTVGRNPTTFRELDHITVDTFYNDERFLIY